METKSIHQLAIETLMRFEESKTRALGYNDYGSIMRVRYEIDLIERELTETLNRVGLRCVYLNEAIRNHESGEYGVYLREKQPDQVTHDKNT